MISPRHVLTAAHCTTRSKIDVIVGEHRVSSSRDGTRHTSCRIVDHPKYNNPVRMDNDFAILHLNKPVDIGPRAAPACLAKSSWSGGFFVGKSLTVSGWGTLSSGGSQPDVLHTVNVPGVSNAQCNKAYGGITDQKLCAAAAGGGVDSCQGDSGGKKCYLYLYKFNALIILVF